MCVNGPSWARNQKNVRERTIKTTSNGGSVNREGKKIEHCRVGRDFSPDDVLMAGSSRSIRVCSAQKTRGELHPRAKSQFVLQFATMARERNSKVADDGA